MSFALTSQVDSRTIIDSAGAEKLLGRGDMLYMPQDASKPKRLQGTMVGDAEIERLVTFWAGQRRQAVVARQRKGSGVAHGDARRRRQGGVARHGH